ncbi:putative Ig domain-containing protein [Streptomyces sp. NPDC048361]|uniref:putative Ig domain-containing protein n=1 Tax=Streptomyces sp. NPDC048361 TaxID=3154720 RepID=UPI003424994D
MRSPTYRRAAATAAAVAAFAGLAALPAHARALPVRALPAFAPEPSVPADVRAAMARDLGLTPVGVRLRIAAERDADRSATTLRATLGDRLAGLWFDAADGRLHADVTAVADGAAVERAGAVPRVVRHSAAQLADTTRLITTWGGPGAGLLSWGPDPRANRIDVVLDPDRAGAATSLVRSRLASLGDLVSVTVSRDTPRQQGGSVVGGESWVPGTESPCSIGFPVTRSGGAKAFLTAGHCTNDVDQPAYGKDGTRMGTSNKNGTGSVDSADGDFGIVDVDQAGWDLSSKVSGWGKGDVNLTGSEDALVGTAVCHSGQTTGFQCGEVTKVDQTVDYGNVVINGLSYTSACSAGGDSGGSYVTATGGKAVGLHSGGGSATCSSGSGEKFTIFQPVNEALATFGATLATVSSQPGEVTVGAVAARSNPTGSAVELRNSAEGGTAPYTWSATGLPPGLGIEATTGTVSGTPSKTGTYAVTVTATDHAGKSGSAGFTWTITAPGTGGPTLGDPGSQSVYVGRPVSLALHAAGGTGPYTFTAANLPAGLTIGSTTGVVSGTPTAWGSRNATLTVTDAAGRKASVAVAFTVWF